MVWPQLRTNALGDENDMFTVVCFSIFYGEACIIGQLSSFDLGATDVFLVKRCIWAVRQFGEKKI